MDFLKKNRKVYYALLFTYTIAYVYAHTHNTIFYINLGISMTTYTRYGA